MGSGSSQRGRHHTQDKNRETTTSYVVDSSKVLLASIKSGSLMLPSFRRNTKKTIMRAHDLFHTFSHWTCPQAYIPHIWKKSGMVLDDKNWKTNMGLIKIYFSSFIISSQCISIQIYAPAAGDFWFNYTNLLPQPSPLPYHSSQTYS